MIRRLSLSSRLVRASLRSEKNYALLYLDMPPQTSRPEAQRVTKEALLGHRNGSIISHYNGAKRAQLTEAANMESINDSRKSVLTNAEEEVGMKENAKSLKKSIMPKPKEPPEGGLVVQNHGRDGVLLADLVRWRWRPHWAEDRAPLPSLDGRLHPLDAIIKIAMHHRRFAQ